MTLKAGTVVQIDLECMGKTGQCVMRCKQIVPVCWQVRGKGKCKSGLRAKCGCGKSSVDNHRLFCQCTAGRKQGRRHFGCLWAVQVHLLAPDFQKARIIASSNNHMTHPRPHELEQKHYKIPDGLKDQIDLSRIQDRTGPRAFQTCEHELFTL